MTDVPKLDLTCLKNPGGRCVLVAESCVNCRNRDIVLAHAAAYQREMDKEGSSDDYIINGGARDAVLNLLPEELKEKTKKETEGVL